MTRKYRRRRFALPLAAHLFLAAALAAPVPALAMQILDAADHAELKAEISATGVNRIALAADRIAKVVRAPDGYAVEHDGASGDLYLRPLSRDAGAAGDPVTLFIGTERGFTYRLTLTPSDRDSAQILIRNAAALPATKSDPRIGGSLPRPASRGGRPLVAALVRLVRAVARRAPLPGYAIRAGGDRILRHPAVRLAVIETWRGPRLSAHVLEADLLPSAGAPGATDLAGTIARSVGSLPGAGRVAALWLAAPGTGPSGGRLVVAVTEAAGGPR